MAIRRRLTTAIQAVAWAFGFMCACANAGPAVISAGDYPEGLLWQQGRMLFAEMGADRISAIDLTMPNPAKRTFWTDPGCGPTSIAPFGPGSYLVNCHLGRQVVEVSAEGITGRRFGTTPDGKPFQNPNASASDGAGGVYFSDSGTFSTEAPATGRVYHVAFSGALTEVARDIHYANGVAFDIESRTLYVSEHLARRILAFRLDPSQRVLSSGEFTRLSQPATQSISYPLAGPDGIALRPGLLAVAEYGEGRVHLFDRTGKPVRTLDVAMPFVDTVAWDNAGNLYAGGAYSNASPPYEGRVVRFEPAAWQPDSQSAAPSASVPQRTDAGMLEQDVRSAFSHIRIRRQGSQRSMMFVRDNGQEVTESRVDLDRRHVLQVDYLKYFAAAFLLRPRQEHVLIVGLGGGGMIHFLRRFSPQTRIDVVEIDPDVIQLANEYFGVRPGDGVEIIATDGLKFLAQTSNKYDVIYLDAFLKPSEDTDATGAPLALRTRQFYRQVQSALNPDGLVAFNLNLHDGVVADLRDIILSFPQTYMFPLDYEVVAIGSTRAVRASDADLEREARKLDEQLNEPALSFRVMAQHLYH